MSACAWVIALAIGSVIGTIRTTQQSPWLVRVGNAWVELFRNIPLLVQMFLWYFVIPEFIPPLKSWIVQDRSGERAVPLGGALPRPLHLGARRRAGARGHPVAAARPAHAPAWRSGSRTTAGLSLRAAADGVPHHHPAAHQRDDEPDQELVDRAHHRPRRADVPRRARWASTRSTSSRRSPRRRSIYIVIAMTANRVMAVRRAQRRGARLHRGREVGTRPCISTSASSAARCRTCGRASSTRCSSPRSRRRRPLLRHAARARAAVADQAAGAGRRGYVNLMRSIPLVLVLFWFFFLMPQVLQIVTGARAAAADRRRAHGDHHVHHVRGRVLLRDHARRHPVDRQGAGELGVRAGPDLRPGDAARSSCRRRSAT